MPQARLEKSKKYEKVKKIFGAVSIAMIVLLGAVAILIWRSLCWVLQTWDNLTMEEIALQTGYNSTTYFHKIFRSKFGVSPRQWQQTMSEK